MSPDCESFNNLLNEYIDGTINCSELKILNSHLKTCKGCTEELKALKLTVNTIKKLQKFNIPEAKETFSDEIINKLEAMQKHKNIIFFPTVKYAVASILLVALFVFFSLHYITRNNPNISNNTNNAVIEEYADDFNNIIYESDSSIIADSDISSDDNALIELYGN